MAKITLNGVEVTLTQEQIDQILKENEKKSGYPENDTEFWYLTSYGEAIYYHWEGEESEHYMFDTGNYYETKAEAEKALEKLQALARIRKYIRENDLGVVPDWSDRNRAAYIYYSHSDSEFLWEVYWYLSQETNIGYLKSSEACEQVIKDCKDDLLTYFGVEK